VSKEKLRAVLGDDLDVIDDLTDDEAGELLEMFDAARTEAMDDLVASLNESLKHVPRVLRGPVKLALFPKGH